MILRVASTIVHDLRTQPALLALIVINVLFLIGGVYVLHDRATSNERKDALIASLVERCTQPAKKGDRE
jgi:hypothetical protein